MALKMSQFALWVVTSSELVDRNYRFGGTFGSIFHPLDAKMEAVCWSETAVSIYKSTRYCITREHNAPLVCSCLERVS
jgi:hypothetical protein